MKIVTKEAHLRIEPIEVLEESPTYYIDVFGIARPKKHYEPVPEVAWRDVTDECTFDAVGTVCDCTGGYMQSRVLELLDRRYRLRKVCVNESEDSVFHDIKTAFIIERKEPA